MAIDLTMFADKLQRYCRQFDVSLQDLSEGTGISIDRLTALCNKQVEPTGDEILILADYFKCDYKFFISNERLAPFEQTENLFRKLGDVLTVQDKWAIQEFLFLCECQEFLLSQRLDGSSRRPFPFSKVGNYFKRHGKDAAADLRRHLDYADNVVPIDIYHDFRQIGIHVFRRQLGQSSISGLFVRHPVAGPCVLVNYSEDVYRQRFTAAHEAAHSILDGGEDFVISFSKWDQGDLSEVRANTFASHYLMPPTFLRSIPSSADWDKEKLLDWAKRLKVNPEVLVYALKEAGLLSDPRAEVLKQVRIPPHEKDDPELPASLSSRSRERKQELIKRGLSNYYVGLCFDAYDLEAITAGRLAEMLLCSDSELMELCDLYGRRLTHVD
jgi:Zn-dependent peptidase ImmA (M78 family)/plasmid maintenance system antidote protein VapI